ncbi:MAG: hypothetical protein A2Y25_03850 [Candidatus Melainabacteria bacterium GWF2_37_15]|nr:MAG: hypothetical protein A2Y25_03850 [Candidatus Melainabacteria bacterium GWF2_37_15]
MAGFFASYGFSAYSSISTYSALRSPILPAFMPRPGVHQKGWGGPYANNSMFGGIGPDVQRGGSGYRVNNYMNGRWGNDLQIGGNGFGTRNTMVGASGSDRQIGGGFGTQNIFRPGTGNNVVTTRPGSNNYVDLSTFDNKYGNNIVNGAAGRTTVNVSNYRGDNTILNLNKNDTIQYNPFTGINPNVTVNGNPRYQPLFII